MSNDNVDKPLENQTLNLTDNEINAFKPRGLKRTPINTKYTPLFDNNDDRIKYDNFLNRTLHEFPPKDNTFFKPLKNSPQISNDFKDSPTDLITQNLAQIRNDPKDSTTDFITQNSAQISNNFKDSPTDFVTQRKKPTPTNSIKNRVEFQYEIFINNESIELDTFSLDLKNRQKQDNYRRIIESSLKNCLFPPTSLNLEKITSSKTQSPQKGAFLNLDRDWSLSENMAIPIRDITDLIKEFKGDEKELNGFIKNIDKLWNHIIQYEEQDKIRFMLFLQLKLTGKAAEATKNVEFNNWDEVKRALKENINPQKNIEKAELKLSTVKQSSNEDTETYAKRVEELLENLNKSFDLEGNNELIKNQNDRKARKAFESGLLNQNLKKLAISRGTKSLREAIDYIVEQELRQVEMKSVPIDKYCTFCKTKYHDITECRSIQRNRVESNVPSSTKYCTFCRIKYHDISECRNYQRSQANNSTNNTQTNINSRYSNVICYKCNQPGHLASACFQQNSTINDKNQTNDARLRNSNFEQKTPPPNSPRRNRSEPEPGRIRLYEADTFIEDISDTEDLN